MQTYKFIKQYRVFFFVIFTFFFCQNAWSEKVSTLQGKPIFKLEIKGQGLRFFIEVNGNNVLNQFDPQSQIATELYINQWMHPEQNTFSVVAIPQYGSIIKGGGLVMIDLIIQDADNSNINYRLPIIELNTNSLPSQKEIVTSSKTGHYYLGMSNQVVYGKGAIELEKISKSDYTRYDSGAITYSRKALIPNSLPVWAFFNSDELPDYFSETDEQNFESIEDLFEEYKKVQEALVSGDVNSIMPLFKERNHEGDLAFYLPPGTMEEKLKTSMLDNINNPDWILQIRTKEGNAIIRESNKKLVSLFKAKQANIIGFVNKNDGRYNNYPIKFRRENGKWVLTR